MRFDPKNFGLTNLERSTYARCQRGPPALWSLCLLLWFGLRGFSKDSYEFCPLTFVDVSFRPSPKILGTGKFAFLLVALWRRDAKDQRFQLTQVAVADGQVNAEAIP